jgi:hypothetical protein
MAASGAAGREWRSDAVGEAPCPQHQPDSRASVLSLTSQEVIDDRLPICKKDTWLNMRSK